VFHLGDGPLLDRLIQPFALPVFAHLGVDHVLVDRGQFLGQAHIQVLDDLLIPFHA
jgi:hypothetical protein